MSGGGHNDGSGDRVRVHAGLSVVVESYQSPIGDDSGYTLFALKVFSDDEILDGGGVHEYDVRHCENLRQDCGSEQSCMLYNNE